MLKNIIKKSKKALFTYNNQPFSKFSIFLIVLLDIFILITIMNGINSKKEMSPNIYTRFPQDCVNHFDETYKKEIWNNIENRYILKEDKFPFKEYSSFKDYSLQGYYSNKPKRIKDDIRVHPLCRELDEKIEVFTKTKEWKKNKRLLENLKNEKRNTLSSIDGIERRYNTTLFEKQAINLSPELTRYKREYYNLLNKEKNIDIQIREVKPVNKYKGYKEYVEFIQNNKEKFKEEFKSYKFWQPFISFLYLLKFTIPLLLISIFLYKLATKTNQKETVPTKITELISVHIIFITSIPIFFNLLYLIYSIIPHRFLENLANFLYSIGFLFLGYYFLLFAGIILFGLLIFFVQKKVSEKEKERRLLKEKRLYIDSYNKSICPKCKNKVDYDRSYCGYCKEELLRTCKNCNSKTPKNIKYCLDCGNK